MVIIFVALSEVGNKDLVRL